MADKVKWYDAECEYCGERVNSWDRRCAKALAFDFEICERCIAEEYGMDVDYLRDRMAVRFGVHPCEGI